MNQSDCANNTNTVDWVLNATTLIYQRSVIWYVCLSIQDKFYHINKFAKHVIFYLICMRVKHNNIL